jgi:hypothetical protein
MGRRMSFENFSYFYVEDTVDDFIRSGQGTCATCEFCFPNNTDDKGNVDYYVCADAHYDEKITDYNTTRDCWSIGLDEYTRRREEYKKKHNMEKIAKDGYELYLQHGKFIALNVESGTWSITEKKDKNFQQREE